MLTGSSLVPRNFSCAYVRTCGRSEANPNLSRPLTCLKYNQKSPFLGNQMLQLCCTSLELQYASKAKLSGRNIAAYSGIESELPHPSSLGSWIWILGTAISVILPFWRNKLWPLQQLKNKVESVMETAEHIADIVEDVAEQVEKLADDIADHLPEGGKLKEAVMFVETVARETAKNAHLAGEVIGKVEEVEKAVESLVEPVADKAKAILEESED